jgi:hypothetical protein
MRVGDQETGVIELTHEMRRCREQQLLNGFARPERMLFAISHVATQQSIGNGCGYGAAAQTTPELTGLVGGRAITPEPSFNRSLLDPRPSPAMTDE